MQDWMWLIIVIVAIIIVWWLLTRAAKEEPDVHVEHTAEEHGRAESVSAPVVPDDLTVLEGIGPKINILLKEAGITTFAQLAETEVEKLRTILNEANLRIADPATWPEQAKLAAEGKWDEFEKLTAELKGGRRVA